MAENEKAEKPPTQYIYVPSIESEARVGMPTVWQTYSFAPEWLEDAIEEARADGNHNARRREIIFAVSFVESYLFEWVRDQVLNRDFDLLAMYFPPSQKKGIRDKWKDVPKKLKSDGAIPAAPDYSRAPGQEYWSDFNDLVDMRDGLIHASSSRPETNPQPPGVPGPHPSKRLLDQLQAGDATKAVVALVRHLHSTIRTTAPLWLTEP